MDIRTELLREHSARQTQKLTSYICLHRKHFQELFDVFLHGTPRERQLAADVLGWVAEQRPQWLVPHLEALLAAAQPGTGHHPAVRRSVARALQVVAVPEEWQALAFDTCLAMLLAPAEPVAIKVYALSAAACLARPYPELAQELLAAAQRVLSHTTSAAFRSRAAKEIPLLQAASRS